MYKYLYIPVILTLFFSCNQNSGSSGGKSLADSLHATDTGLKVISKDKLIVPGKSMGNIYIGSNADSLTAILGKPQFSDAAMGAQLMKWDISVDKKKYVLSVYSHRNVGMADEAVSHIKEIRTTSPLYKTADYLGSGSELRDIKKLYKLQMHLLAKGSKTGLYDAAAQGIAFEVDSTGRCSAVSVYAPGDSTSTYLDIR